MNTDSEFKLTPEILLNAYALGVFPMSEAADDPEIFWVEPDIRGWLPLDEFHISRSLRKFMKKNPFEVKINTAFSSVIKLCAQEAPDRNSTWINKEINTLCNQLHLLGHAHSVECWEGDMLVGGLYGVSLGGAFFGESMFSRKTNASKIALVHLVHRLRTNGFSLLDTQFSTPHLETFGVKGISKSEYKEKLDFALQLDADFSNQAGGGTSEDILQSVSQIS